MNERKLFEGILIFICCIVAVVLGKVVSRGDLILTIAPFIGIIGVYLGFRYRTLLPAITLGMMWYGGGSPFVPSVPYPFYALMASVGIAFFEFSMKRKQESISIRDIDPVLKIPLLCLGFIILQYAVITVLKHKGFLPASSYGVAGGLKNLVKFSFILVFIYLLFNGNISRKKLKSIPMVAVVIAVSATALDTLNYINPQTAFITYYFTTGLNFEVLDVLRGATDSVLRLASLRELGLYLTLFIFSIFVIKNKRGELRKVPMKYLVLLGGMGLIILIGGFRNYLIRYALVLMLFFLVYDRKWAIASIAAGGSIWLGAIGMGHSLDILPVPIQRVLGSLPGVYQTDVAVSAMGGLAWRAELRSRFWDNEFWRHPWFGRGQIGDFFVVPESAYADPILFFEVTQLWHSGWVSSLDAVGIVGTAVLIVAQLSTLGLSIKLLCRYQTRLEGWMIWCTLYFYAANIIFWYNGFFLKQFPMMALSMVGVCLVYDVIKRQKCEFGTQKRKEILPQEMKIDASAVS